MKQYFENIADYSLNNPTKTTFALLITLIVLILVSKIKEWLELRNYFQKLGVPGPKPKFLLGNFRELMVNGMINFDLEILKKYGKTVGYFEGTQPVLMTRDVKFLKSVMVKDFSHFVNRRVFDGILLPPFDKFLTNVKDEEWKNMRSIITTTFSSGKLKSMSKNMKKLSNNMSKFLEGVANDDKILDTRHFFGSYTIDIIASCCFGMEINSVNDPENEFLKQLIKANSTNFKSPKVALLFVAPRLAKLLAKYDLVHFFPMDAVGFLSDVTQQIINKRKSKEETREDFIQHMIEVEGEDNQPKNEASYKSENVDNFNNIKLKKTLSFNEILCTAILFLSAGYETTAVTLSFIAYHLAMNQDIQDKLIEEIDGVLEKHGGEVSYESVNDMPYLEMVIEETQRMYPAASRIDRVCNQDYEFEGMKIKKGQLWVASIYALHYDEDLYPNPEQFDPERFNETNKKSRDNISHIPFGAGPRSCIAMRFAVLEMKILLATLLSKFKFVKCDQTEEKIKLDKTSPITRPETSLKLKVVNRF